MILTKEALDTIHASYALPGRVNDVFLHARAANKHIALLKAVAEAAFHSGTCARLQPLYAIDESKCDCGLGEALTAAKAGGAM